MAQTETTDCPICDEPVTTDHRQTIDKIWGLCHSRCLELRETDGRYDE